MSVSIGVHVLQRMQIGYSAVAVDGSGICLGQHGKRCPTDVRM